MVLFLVVRVSPQDQSFALLEVNKRTHLMGNSELVLVYEHQRLSQSQLVVCYTHLQFVHMLCLSYTRGCNW